ncbi:MAG: hypothetical protein ACOY4W_06585 [Thermodesulfobacteriota bacterium]
MTHPEMILLLEARKQGASEPAKQMQDSHYKEMSRKETLLQRQRVRMTLCR